MSISFTEAPDMNLKPIIALLALCIINQGAHAAGQLDMTYGSGGYFENSPVGIDFTTFDVADDGSVLAAGIGETDCAVTAVTADGILDAAWGEDGLLRFPCLTALRPAVLRAADGRVVVAYAAANHTLVVSRLNQDATIDTSFGAGGSAAITVPGLLYDTTRILATSTGHLWVVATGSAGFGVRMNTDGTGAVTLAITNDWYPAGAPFDLRGLMENDNGSVTAVLAGYTLSPGGAFQTDGLTLAHFNAENGLAVTSRFRWCSDDFRSPAIEVVGPYIYAAFNGLLRGCDFDGTVIRRYMDNDEDWSFGAYGQLTLNLLNMTPESLAVDASGRLYLSGQVSDCGLEPVVCNRRRGLALLLEDGSRVTDFGQDGMAYVDYGGLLDGRGLYVAPAGRVLAIAGSGQRFAMARLDLGGGTSPGRLGLLERYTYGDAGSVAGSSTGNETTIHERSTTLRFRVARSGGDQGAASVQYRITGDALAGDTYQPDEGTLDWTDGDATDREISLFLQASPAQNEGGTIQVVLEDAAGDASLGTARHTVHLLDASAGQIGFKSQNSPSIMEGSTLFVPVGRTGGGNGAVSVRVRARFNDTAGAGDIASIDTETLSWADGETGYKGVRVNLVDDSQVESTERFSLELEQATGGAILGVASVTIAITDNDKPVTATPTPPTPGGGGAVRWLELLLLAAVAAGASRQMRSRCLRQAGPGPGSLSRRSVA
jgi:hypothetical protein